MYNTVIGEKRAKEIIKYFLEWLKKQNNGGSYPEMERFLAEGLAANNLLELHTEFREYTNNGGNNKSIRVAYEDTLRIHHFIEQYVATPAQIRLIEQYGIERIKKFNSDTNRS